MILLQQSVQDLHASDGAYHPALHLSVSVETVPQGDVVPTVRLDNRPVDFGMNLPNLRHIGICLIGNYVVIDQAVKVGQS